MYLYWYSYTTLTYDTCMQKMKMFGRNKKNSNCQLNKYMQSVSVDHDYIKVCDPLVTIVQSKVLKFSMSNQKQNFRIRAC